MSEPESTADPVVAEDAPLTGAEVRALLKRVQVLEADAAKKKVTTPADEPEVASEPEMPEIHPPQIQKGSYENIRKIGKRETPELYQEMRELDTPKARYPKFAMYAVRLKSLGTGFYTGYPRDRRWVELADPGTNRLVPTRNTHSRDVVPEEDMKNPLPNIIGHAFATPWFIPSLGIEVFCDPRAAAHENTPMVEKISLWCPLYELAPDSTHAHEEHGAFCGIDEEPNRIQMLKWEPMSDEEKGLCLGCKDHPEKREAVRTHIERIRR